MKRFAPLAWPVLALLLAVGSAGAGPNAGARARLTWGPSLSDTLTSLTIPAGVDTQIVFYVSVTGLKELRGIDIQLPILGGGGGDKPTALPPAWQFQSGAPCENENNIGVSLHFPGTASLGLETLLTSLAGIYQGTINRFVAFNGMTFFALTAAGSASVTRDPEKRYGLVKVTLTIPAKGCPGIESPLCIRPAMRLGTERDRGPVIGLVDQSLQYDYIGFEPGYDRLTINPGRGACPSPSPSAASAWRRAKGGLKH